MSDYYTKKDRHQIVLTIENQLRTFKIKKDGKINHYNAMMCSFAEEFKKISYDYIYQSDDEPKELKDFSGSLYFEEIQKKIDYVLPSKKTTQPLFVMRK